MQRAFGVALVAVLVLVLAALLWLRSSLDGLVETAIEQVGSDLLGAPVMVGGVSIDLAEGAGTVRGLRVANPSGEGLAFGSAPALALQELTLQLRLGSLTGSPIVLEHLRAARPEINAEVADGKLNLDVLRRRVAARSAAEVAQPGGAATPDGEPLRLRLERFELAEGAIRLEAHDEDAPAREFVLPSFTMTGVGGPGGATPAELGKAVLEELLGRAAGAVARARARGAADAWIDEKLEDRPAAADAAKKVLEGLLGDGGDEAE